MWKTGKLKTKTNKKTTDDRQPPLNSILRANIPIETRKGYNEKGIIRNKNSSSKLNTLPNTKISKTTDKSIEQSQKKEDKNRKHERGNMRNRLDKGKEIQHLNNRSLIRELKNILLRERKWQYLFLIMPEYCQKTRK